MTNSTVSRSKEVRLGVVMYGGVSLAIYINGVSQELFRAVEGQGIYKLAKLCFDTDIVLDIVSGTSAGGDNGLLLAYALANHKDFATTKDLWRESGDLNLLLQDANADPRTCKSLLKSDDFYRKQLAEAFSKLDGHDFDARGCAVSAFDEMDVFITGTTVAPDIYTTFDDAGRALELQDYRKVFRLKHRALRTNKGAFRPSGDEKATRFQAFAKLARITSCFPGAFSPVCVRTAADWSGNDSAKSAAPFGEGEKDIDALLCEWGALKKSNYFLDGGVLNNKPFAPTIEAIFGRTADRPVDRILFYVEPDPEIAPLADAPFSEPSFLSSIICGTVGVGTYQSITDDARLIEEHNTQVVRHSSLCRELQGRLTPFAQSGVGIPQRLPDFQKRLYLCARNTQLGFRAIQGLLWNSRTGTGEHLTSARDREAVRALIHSLNEDRKKSELTHNQTFELCDIYFRKRRLEHVVKRLYEPLKLPGQAETGEICELLSGLNQHIQLLEIIQYCIEFAVDRIPVDWRMARTESDPWAAVWSQVSAFLEQVLVVRQEDIPWLPAMPPKRPDWLSTLELDRVSLNLKKRIETILNSTNGVPAAPQGAKSEDADAPGFFGLLQWTDRAEMEFLAGYRDSGAQFRMAQTEYAQFASLDAVVFPLDFSSNLASLNEIRLLRISPAPTVDENNRGSIGFRADAGADAKLAGKRLEHFAGLLKRSWRSNDILWGRLDGLRHIVLALFSQDRLNQLAADGPLRARIRAAIAQEGGWDELLKQSFAQSPSASRNKLAQFLDGILGANTCPLPEVLNEHVNLLVEMGQLEIISDEIGNVIGDAASQQAEWNRFRRDNRDKSTQVDKAQPATMLEPEKRPDSRFVAPSGFVDPALAGVHAAYEMERLRELWKSEADKAAGPKDTGLGRYFEKTYDVASEGLERGIPPLIIVQQVTRILLVLSACVLGSFPATMRDRITSSWLYKMALRFPLKFGLRLATICVREPKMTAISLTSFLVSSLVAFALASYFIISKWKGHTPVLLTDLNIIAVSLVLLTVSGMLIYKRRALGL